jgi:hypothetical protein
MRSEGSSASRDPRAPCFCPAPSAQGPRHRCNEPPLPCFPPRMPSTPRVASPWPRRSPLFRQTVSTWRRTSLARHLLVRTCPVCRPLPRLTRPNQRRPLPSLRPLPPRPGAPSRPLGDKSLGEGHLPSPPPKCPECGHFFRGGLFPILRTQKVSVAAADPKGQIFRRISRRHTVVRLKTAHPLLLLSRVQKSSTTKNKGGYSNSLLRAVCLNATKDPTVSADLPKHAVEPPRLIGLWSAHSLET